MDASGNEEIDMTASLKAAAVILLACLMVLPSVRAQSAGPFTPRDIRAAYDVDPLLNSGYTGKGVTVAIVNTGIDRSFHSDLGNFSLKYGLPEPNVSLAEPFGSAGTDRESPTSETTADAEMVHAMAPDARLLLILTGYQPRELPAGFSYVIDNNAADIATISPFWFSWGQQGRDAMQSYDREYAKSVAENITLIAASGDWGSNNSVNPPWVAGSPYLIPSYSPYVTVVGGTALTLQSGGYGSETGWNMSGGGPTNVSPEPSWQTAPGVPENGVRNIPDVALDASCETPYAYYWNGGIQSWHLSFCGTSGGAPTFAGIVADIEQAAGRRLGFMNPALYSLASSDPTVFHDVTSGCSLVQVEPGAIVPGYCAHPGWDFVTGLGSIDAERLALHLASSAHIVLSTTFSSTLNTTSSNSLGTETAWFTLSAGIVLAIIASALAFRRRIKRRSQQ
jgi:subtilase family serine protease